MKRLCFIAVAALATVVSCTEIEVGQTPPDVPTPGTEPSKYDYQMYGAAVMNINTYGNAPVVSKDPADYLPCTITIDGKGIFDDYTGTGRIRGRGNSTWDWYDKKPYRIKLDETSDIMGMEHNRDWVLLANFRDPTHLMNNVAFTMAHYMGLPYTNHSRYAEVTLNGEYVGLYMVTEQIEEGGNRVNIDPQQGLLIALDVNDGPEDCPYATDNFWSEIYGMASCVKYPEEPTAAQLAEAKASLAELEAAIESQNYASIRQLLDVKSMIDFLIVQEATRNIEMNNGYSTRSVFMHRNSPADKWVMGPVWDFDNGFAFDWGDMYGHRFFTDYQGLVFGSDPYNQRGAYGGYPEFFSDLFGIPEFVAAFKARWNEVKDGMLQEVQEQIYAHSQALQPALRRDLKLWRINPAYTTEIPKLEAWFDNRFPYIDRVINAYPAGSSGGNTDSDEVTFTGSETPSDQTFAIDVSFAADAEHHSGTSVTLSAEQRKRLAYAFVLQPAEIARKITSNEIVFCAAEPDGSFNPNYTANGFGHWFDAQGYVVYYGDGYVFSEFDPETFTFSIGQYPAKCRTGERYTVSQALIYTLSGKEYTVRFDFDITIL